MNLQKLNKFRPTKNRINIFIRIGWHCLNILFFKSPIFTNYQFKINLLKLFGAKVGKNIVIKPNINIKQPWELEIGDNSWIGEGVWIDNIDKIIIGKNVCVSQGVYLVSAGHDYRKESFDLVNKKIVIEDGVWLGAKSIIAPGVRCKQGSILSLGSVAKNDLESNYIYQGNPAKKYKKR
ncbi:colanic acid biosynthesis acetyltransferase WcaF [Candidatus Berkelbacteria bacterium CG_4_10_14_0_8_um_filter_35_9_33_8]|uniref:Colanic acid biosynthesis acetyltransferase WcaF n=1 Tax=Candidatus Berkelbacteria bacterium CG_4_10_14_0_2_um_filter_35_9_33_12 TaxID=1974499 RepID=A0A2M7W4Q3_9BACT|nr:MAG: colanic acid biosynthesis acetyltransferase WcaF [Candidatus Berkelbacteria bacterium CG23_combo_of_CG06-09_8_20_14_all_33_15]PIS08550.1 MAG: colanic acid biosynthesis acetyltransferase WcaF [Candidatus Berkelbacteria bacterium CG10_big_fil_rev_8_21_14_0_10_33_10]PIZ27960.1 MAG: colanic acid biosynthesis acetyltransferase WcaF [Candidatus Berkelbacteria bacterium CG_4_10_14_0_8_um_filter_35_9_33_8]PJA20316.1 MAG: colanic acid biosynthesis acetyltransferase WcaF [Candidatus Berkelbacteria